MRLMFVSKKKPNNAVKSQNLLALIALVHNQNNEYNSIVMSQHCFTSKFYETKAPSKESGTRNTL